MRIKKNESIWHFMTAGLNADAVRRKLWVEEIPGLVAYRGVTLGRERINFFGKRQILVLYRDFNDKCKVKWVLMSSICKRW